MIDATVAVTASVEEAAKNNYFHKSCQTFQPAPVDQPDCIFYIICTLFFTFVKNILKNGFIIWGAKYVSYFQ